jgi:hypothetical protein
MLPLVVGGGAISLRINYAGVAIHYANVDLLASGPPSADFQTEATTSTSGSFGSLMKFGSSGPTIYDFVLVSIPYTEGSSSATGLNESSQVNMSIPTFYDESYSTPIWSSSNGTDASQLAGNYSHYSTRQAEWQILMNQTTCGTNTSALNRTLPCYINTSDDKIWIRLPHFSGTQPSITGGVITAAVSTSSSGTSGGGSASASETNLAAGYTRQYLAGDATTFKVSGKTHTFIMLYIKNNTAAIQISSSIQKAILSVGEIKKFDVDGDGKYYDLSVKLNSITNNKADITLKSINESMTAAPPVPEAPATAGEKIKETIQQTTAKAKNLGVWLLAIIAAIIVVIIAIIVYYMRKK